MHKTELLAPAGSRESFLGGLAAGADAFYLAGQKFGARAYADNFTEEELVRTIREAHIFGRKIYLTVNTLTREDELPELVSYVHRLYLAGLDGVIVQDLGVIDALREACPGLLLHASTQLSVTSPESVRLLKKMGVCRVVPARELSLRRRLRSRRSSTAPCAIPIPADVCCPDFWAAAAATGADAPGPAASPTGSWIRMESRPCRTAGRRNIIPCP